MTIAEVISFKGAKEKAYQQFFLKQDLMACRAMSYLVIMVMLLLILLDFFRVPDISWVLVARLIVCTSSAVLIYLTHTARFKPIQLQMTLLSINIIFLTSIFFMDSMANMPSFFLTNSICAYLFITVTISGLWFRIGGSLDIAVVGLFLFYFPHSANHAFQKSQVANLLICLAISLLIGFVWERNKRILFNQHIQMNRLLSIFSHDMVSPFNSLLGLLDLNENRSIGQADFEKHVLNIKKATANNVLLLQNLVNWSKSQMEGFRPNLEKTNLNSTIKEAIDLVQNTAREKSVDIRYQPADLFGFVDAEMVKLIIRNVLSNGIKFSKSGGHVEVQTIQNGHFVSVHIQDQGKGMSADQLSALFNGQVKSEQGTLNERGSGIGLYITRQFVNLNKGEIEIESAVGKGSIVKLKFPIA